MIINVLDASREWVKFGLDTKNNGALPLDPTCPTCLNIQSPTNLPYGHIKPKNC
jgi:hypothetical protein